MPTRWSHLALALLLLGAYLITWVGEFRTLDGELMFRTTESLVERGSFVIACQEDLPGELSRGPQERCYAPYFPLQSVMAVPLYLAGQVVEAQMPQAEYGLYPRLAVALLPLLLTWITALVVLATAQRLYGQSESATVLFLIYGLGTLAWPYTRLYHNQHSAMLLLLLAFAAAVLVARPAAAAVLSAAFLALAVLSRNELIVSGPAVGAYLLWRTPPRQRLGIALRFGALAAGGVLGVLLFNAYRFGSPLASDYPLGTLLNSPWPAVYGLLASPTRGILFFSPVVLLLVPAAVRWWRERRIELLLMAGMLLPAFTLYTTWKDWPGGTTWGPRFLVHFLPILVLPLGSLFPLRPWHWAVVAASVVAQLLGILVPFQLTQPPYGLDPNRYVELRYIPWPAHVRYLVGGRPWDVGIHSPHRLGLDPASVTAYLLLGAGLFLLGLGLLVRRRSPGVLLWAGLAAVLAIAVVWQGIAQSGSDPDELQPHLTRAPARAEAEPQAVYGGELALTSCGRRDRLLRLDWSSAEHLDRTYKIFIHFLDGEGERIAQVDEPLGNAFYSTGYWPVGVAVSSWHDVPREEGGRARHAYVGLYDGESMERLPAEESSGASLDGNALPLDLSRCREAG